jgi:hypothetical protein
MEFAALGVKRIASQLLLPLRRRRVLGEYGAFGVERLASELLFFSS